MTGVGTWRHCFLCVLAQVGAYEDMKVRFLVEKAMCVGTTQNKHPN